MSGGLYPPPSVLATWPKPNYVNPETRGWSETVVLIVFMAITLLVVSARFWARLVVSKSAGLDDVLIAIAVLPLLGLTIATCLGARTLGFQVHSWDHTPENAVVSRKVVIAIEVLYILSTVPTKISILFFYRRMAVGTISKTFIRCVWASVAFVAAYGISFLIALPFTCDPVNAFWDFLNPTWSATHKFWCHDESKELLAAASISIVQDIITCVLPVMLLWNLQLPRRQKLAVYGIFGLGGLTIICGAFRIYYVDYVYYHTYDISWWCLPGWLWTCIEADLAVICASAPALKVFFRRYLNISGQRSGHSMGYIQNTFSNSRNTDRPNHSRSWSDQSNTVSPRLPADGIKVSQGMEITIEDRGDSTSELDGSTRSSSELTSLPNVQKNLPTTPRESRIDRWPSSSRTVCLAAFGPKEATDDIERNPGTGWR